MPNAPPRKPPDTREAVLRRYPRLCAHIICESLGYATPGTAASVLLAAMQREPHYCEWIAAVYRGNPGLAVQGAIRHRHTHEGYMASYPVALRLVRHAIATGNEPLFASWF